MKKTDDDLEMKLFTIIALAAILAIMLMVLISCTPSRSITYTEVKTTGGTWEENDSIVNNDTLYFWK